MDSKYLPKWVFISAMALIFGIFTLQFNEMFRDKEREIETVKSNAEYVLDTNNKISKLYQSFNYLLLGISRGEDLKTKALDLINQKKQDISYGQN